MFPKENKDLYDLIQQYDRLFDKHTNYYDYDTQRAGDTLTDIDKLSKRQTNGISKRKQVRTR